MKYDLSIFDSLPLRGKVSVTYALFRIEQRGVGGYMDFDISNRSRNRYKNTKCKNAKAKHRKKYSR